MSEFFLDASAIVKRYADETGSAWVRQITNPDAQNTILLSEITLAEISAALAAKQRGEPRRVARLLDDDAAKLGEVKQRDLGQRYGFAVGQSRKLQGGRHGRFASNASLGGRGVRDTRVGYGFISK